MVHQRFIIPQIIHNIIIHHSVPLSYASPGSEPSCNTTTSRLYCLTSSFLPEPYLQIWIASVRIIRVQLSHDGTTQFACIDTRW